MLATHPVPIVDDEAAEPTRLAVCLTCEEQGYAILLTQERQSYGRGREWFWRRCPNERPDGRPHQRQALA